MNGISETNTSISPHQNRDPPLSFAQILFEVTNREPAPYSSSQWRDSPESRHSPYHRFTRSDQNNFSPDPLLVACIRTPNLLLDTAALSTDTKSSKKLARVPMVSSTRPRTRRTARSSHSRKSAWVTRTRVSHPLPFVRSPSSRRSSTLTPSGNYCFSPPSPV